MRTCSLTRLLLASNCQSSVSVELNAPPDTLELISEAVFTLTHFLLASNCQNCHTLTRPFNGPLSGTTRVGRYQKGKTILDFTGARDSEWQWHQLGHMLLRRG